MGPRRSVLKLLGRALGQHRVPAYWMFRDSIPYPTPSDCHERGNCPRHSEFNKRKNETIQEKGLHMLKRVFCWWTKLTMIMKTLHEDIFLKQKCLECVMLCKTDKNVLIFSHISWERNLGKHSCQGMKSWRGHSEPPQVFRAPPR